jgi:dehydrogenase/reductase SDR family protein 12
MPDLRKSAADALDLALEVTIAGSFSTLGYRARRATGGWPSPARMDGRRVLVTGASSGIGRAAAAAFAGLGAEVWLIGRDRERLVAAAGSTGHAEVCDLADKAAVADLAERVKAATPRLDVVVHNAGALFPDRREAPDGVELTVATHVLAPFRLTRALEPLLASAGRAAIITVSSGGMYSEPFALDRLEMGPSDYRGAVAYARAKRAQVVLAHEWSRRLAGDGILSYSMHPGWVTTPGLDAGLPRFAKLGPVLRSPEQGADTIVWLGAEALARSVPPPEGFWLDRRRRGEYYRPATRRSPEEQRADGERLWEWCLARA